MNRTNEVLLEVAAERARQERLLAEGRFPFNCADPERLNIEKLPIVGEEFGEVSREVWEVLIGNPGAKERLRVELIQLAAVAVAWAEALPAPEAAAHSQSQIADSQ